MAEYKKLDVYRKADECVLLIYQVTKFFPKEELFGLISQMRRAAVSVVANFVEGYGRKGLKEKIQFYYMSLGSLNELGYYIDLSFKLGYLPDNRRTQLSQLQTDTVMLFNGYLRGLKNSQTI